jgi:enoyl-CoA hydratase/carnithine racemase
MYETIVYDVTDHVARITLNRPAARNALNDRMTEELLAAFDRAAAADDVRVIVLTGAGDKAFCAGADLGNLGAQLREPPMDDAAADSIRRSAPYRLFTAIPRLGKPIIARLAGHAIAGGLGLAVACDIVIAADDIKLGTPEVNVGLWPMMIMAIINRNVPPKQAFRLYYTGRNVSAREGVGLGLISEAVPRAELDARVDELAGAIAAKSPIGLRMGREAFFASEGLPFDDQIALLLERLRVLAATDDAAEGVTAFLERRTPRFTGR